MNAKKNNTSTTAFQFEKTIWIPHSKFKKEIYFGLYAVAFCFITWLNWKFVVGGFFGEDSVPSLWWLLPVVFWVPVVRNLYNFFVGEKHRINRNIETIAREGSAAVEMTVTEIKKTKVKKYRNRKTACMTFINFAGQEMNDYPVDITGNNLPKKDLIGKKFGFIVDPKIEVYPFIFLCLLFIVGYNLFWYYIYGIEEMFLTDYISLLMTPIFMTVILYLLKYADSIEARQDVLLTFYGVKTVGRLVHSKYFGGESAYYMVTVEFPLQNGTRYRTIKRLDEGNSSSSYIPNRSVKGFEEEDMQVLYLPSKPDMLNLYPMEKKEKK